jgi:hypothetical protein
MKYERVNVKKIRLLCRIQSLPYLNESKIKLSGSFARSNSDIAQMFMLKTSNGRQRNFFWADRRLGIAFDKHHDYFLLIE